MLSPSTPVSTDLWFGGFCSVNNVSSLHLMEFSSVNLLGFNSYTFNILQHLIVFFSKEFHSLISCEEFFFFVLSIFPNNSINILWTCFGKTVTVSPHSSFLYDWWFYRPLSYLSSVICLSDWRAFRYVSCRTIMFLQLSLSNLFWVIPSSIMPFLRCKERDWTYYSMHGVLWIDTEVDVLQCSLFHS